MSSATNLPEAFSPEYQFTRLDETFSLKTIKCIHAKWQQHLSGKFNWNCFVCKIKGRSFCNQRHGVGREEVNAKLKDNFILVKLWRRNCINACMNIINENVLTERVTTLKSFLFVFNQNTPEPSWKPKQKHQVSSSVASSKISKLHWEN